MKAIFYNNTSREEVVNKKLEELYSINFNFKENTSILYPTLILKNYDGGNYCYIKELNKFYYITNIDLMNNKLFEISLEIDVLKTYENELSNSKIYIQDVETIENELESDNLDSDNFILIVGD